MSDRALTIKQPWASLIMAGVKDVENRSWPVPSTMPQWMTCLGCYAEAEPDDVAEDPECPRPCACDNGYTVEPGAGILDSRHVRDWVPSTDVGSPTHVGPFPFRLWIHAGKHSDSHAQTHAWEDLAMRKVRRGYGVLLGSVTVTGCHHSNECAQAAGDGMVPGCSSWAEPAGYHWTLADPQPLDEPIPMKGRQGLWRVSQVGDRGGVTPTPTPR